MGSRHSISIFAIVLGNFKTPLENGQFHQGYFQRFDCILEEFRITGKSLNNQNVWITEVQIIDVSEIMSTQREKSRKKA